MTLAGRGETDSMFTSVMLGTQSVKVDHCFPDVEL